MAANLSITDRPPVLDNIFREAPDTPPRTVSVWLVAAVILAAVAALWWLGLPWWAATAPIWGVPAIVFVVLPLWAAFLAKRR